jgi:hypothetical protein
MFVCVGILMLSEMWGKDVRLGTLLLHRIATPFNLFIEDKLLIDLPLCGRRFTWFKGDGISMSRLDRFLLSEEWCLNWPNCLQIVLLRGDPTIVLFSCPLMRKSGVLVHLEC